MEWMRDPLLGGLWSEPVPAMPYWEKVGDTLERAGVEVLRLPDFHMVMHRHGRVARFQHAAGRMRRFQARMLRAFLDDADVAPPGADGGGGGMRRRGWTAAVRFEARDEKVAGRLLLTTDLVEFHADTVANLVAAFGWAVDDYEAAYRRLGRPMPEPALRGGGVRLRMRPRVHHLAVQAAAARGMSLNAWMEQAAERMARSELRSV